MPLPSAKTARCCFAPPSVQNLRSSFVAIQRLSPIFLMDFQSISVSKFQSVPVDFSHFQSFSVIFNHFLKLAFTFNHLGSFKTQEFFDNRKVEENSALTKAFSYWNCLENSQEKGPDFLFSRRLEFFEANDVSWVC